MPLQNVPFRNKLSFSDGETFQRKTVDLSVGKKTLATYSHSPAKSNKKICS